MPNLRLNHKTLCQLAKRSLATNRVSKTPFGLIRFPKLSRGLEPTYGKVWAPRASQRMPKQANN